jgi:hypothetical protein
MTDITFPPAALREKVAEELWQAESVRAVGTRRNIPWSEAGPAARHQWLPLADAAIAVCMEEAARTRPKPVDEEAHHLKATDYTAGWNAAVRACAAAIRGLIGKD